MKNQLFTSTILLFMMTFQAGAQMPGDIQTIIAFNDCCNDKEESSAGLDNSFGSNIGVTLYAHGAGDPFNSSVDCPFGQEYISNGWRAGARWETGQFNTKFHGGITAEWIQMNFANGPGGPKQFQISIDSTTWIDVGSTYNLGGGCPSGPTRNEFLPAIVDNQPVVYLRWLNINGRGPGGSRIADILVEGELCKGIECAVTISGVTTSLPTCPEKRDGSITINSSSCSGPDCDGALEYSIDAGETFQSTNVFIVDTGSYDVLVRTKDNPCCIELYDANPIILGFDDTEFPSISSCPDNMSQVADVSICTAIVNWTHPTTSDNCASPKLMVAYTAGLPVPASLPTDGTVTSGGADSKTFAKGKTIVSYTVHDAGGNEVSTCSFEVVVVDVTPPTIACPSDPSPIEWSSGFNTSPVEPNMAQDPSITPETFGSPTAFDNCGTPSLMFQDIISGPFPENCPNLWIVTRTWIATDSSGLSTECQQMFTFTDQTPPSIICPSDQSFECPAGLSIGVMPSDVPQDQIIDPSITGHPVTDDNGGVASVSFQDILVGPTPGNCPNLWVVSRRWSATDLCGLTNFCFQTFTLTDSSPPDLICPLDPQPLLWTEDFNTGVVSANVSQDPTIDPDIYGYATASDNCGNPTITFQDLLMGPNPNNCPVLYIIERTWTASDLCGLSSSCVQSFEFILEPIIPHNIAGSIKICPIFKELQYSVDHVQNATNYNWTFSDASAMIMGNGATTVSISFDDTFEGGILSVTADNACGTSEPRTMVLVPANSVLCDEASCLSESEALIIDNSLISSLDVFQNYNRIESAASINSPRKVTFKAGYGIQLNPLFEVKLGATFISKIETCLE